MFIKAFYERAEYCVYFEQAPYTTHSLNALINEFR